MFSSLVDYSDFQKKRKLVGSQPFFNKKRLHLLLESKNNINKKEGK